MERGESILGVRQARDFKGLVAPGRLGRPKKRAIRTKNDSMKKRGLEKVIEISLARVKPDHSPASIKALAQDGWVVAEDDFALGLFREVFIEDCVVGCQKTIARKKVKDVFVGFALEIVFKAFSDSSFRFLGELKLKGHAKRVFKAAGD